MIEFEVLATLLGGSLLMIELSRRWIARRARYAHVIDTRTAWVRAGQRVHFGPVSAISYGPLPQRVYQGGVFGALGITDGRIVFSGLRNHRADIALPFADVRRLVLCTVRVHLAPRITRSVRALALHYDTLDGWRVAVLVADDAQALALAISAHSGLPVHDGGSSADFGPMPAARMMQDVYGEWAEDRAGILYLAPDRLLFNWRDVIPLDAITRIDVLHQAGEAAGLLRIEHKSPDDTSEAGKLAVTGFLVHQADAWADALRQRIDAPIPVFTGRKKKDA